MDKSSNPQPLVFSITLVLLAANSWLVLSFSTNLLFNDQWDFFTPLFEGQGLDSMFFRQHGEHYEGVGLIVTSILYGHSGWDTRLDSASILFFLLLALSAAFFLNKLIFKKTGWHDIILPLLFLSSRNREAVLLSPNLSYSAMMLLLLTIYCLAWTIKPRYHRYFAVGVLNFLLMFSGYGLFIAPITLILLFLDGFRAIKKDKKRLEPLGLPILAFAFSCILFIKNYALQYSAACFDILNLPAANYLKYVLRMLGGAFNITVENSGSITYLPAGITLTLLIFTIVKSFKDIIKCGQDFDRIVFILTCFTACFIFATSIGRACLDLPHSHRYFIYIVPGLLGLFFYMKKNLQGKLKPLFTITLIILLSLDTIHLFSDPDHDNIIVFQKSKAKWKKCYLSTENIQYCNNQTILKIHPNPDSVNMDKKMTWFKKNKLNLYKKNTN